MIHGKTLSQLVVMLIILLLVFISAAIFFRPLIDKKQRKWTFSIFFGAVLSAIVILGLQGGSYIFAEEASPIARLHDLKIDLGGFGDRDLSTDGFFFINTARNLSLLRDNGYAPPRSSAVADRAMLNEVFRFLNAHQQDFDIVACDLLFAQKDSLNDAHLCSIFHQLGLNDKLVLAYNSPLIAANKNFYDRLDASMLAEVGKAGNGPVYFSSDLISQEGRTSFAYNIYLKLHKENQPESGFIINEKKGIAFNNYIPEFQVTSEKAIWPIAFTSGENMATSGEGHDLQLQKNDHLYDLGNLTLWEEQLSLLQALKKVKGKPKVIFIGSFSDPQIDVHQTAYGSLHGLAIMVNELVFLMKGHHLFSIFTLLCFVIIQWALYTGIFVYLFWRNVDKINAHPENKNPHLANRLDFISSIFGFILDELYFVLLLGISLFINIIFHRLTNFITLLYIIVPFSYFLKYLTINYLNKRKAV